MNSISEEIIFFVQQIEVVANTTADRKIHMYSIATCDMYLIHR